MNSKFGITAMNETKEKMPGDTIRKKTMGGMSLGLKDALTKNASQVSATPSGSVPINANSVID
jgi:hypothetical protein